MERRRLLLVVALLLVAAPLCLLGQAGRELTKQILESSSQTFNIAGRFNFGAGILTQNSGNCGGQAPPNAECQNSSHNAQIFLCTDTRHLWGCFIGTDGWQDLGTTNCSDGQILKWQGTASPVGWTCGVEVDSTGNPGVTTYTIGTGQQYPTCCGADCTSATSTCAASSALGTHGQVTAGQTVRCDYAPGTYTTDCIRLQTDKVLGTLILRGPPGDLAMLRPTVTSQASIDGGVIGGYGRGGSLVDGIFLIQGLGVHSDDTCLSAVECPAISVGEKNGTTETATNAAGWTRFEYTGGKVRAGGQGILIQGSFAADGIWPTWRVGDGADVIGAQSGVDPQGLYVGVVESNRRVMADTSWCDPCTAVAGGTVQAGSTTTAVILESSAPLSTTQSLEGQALTLAGTCGAAGQTRDILSYATRTATVARAFSATPDPNCTYTVAVRDGCERKDRCTDFDWVTAAGSGSFDNIAGVYARGDGSLTTTANNTGSRLTIRRTPLSQRTTAHGDSAGKKAVIINKFQILDDIFIEDLSTSGGYFYEQTAATCASSSNAIWHIFLNDNEWSHIRNVTLDQEYQGADCDVYGVGLGTSAAGFVFENISQSMRRTSAVNGFTYTKGYFDFDVRSASVGFSASGLSTSNRSLRTIGVPAPLANPALGGWNSAPAGVGRAFSSLGADGGGGGTYAATNNPGAGKCWLYPINVPAPETVNTLHLTDDPATSDAGADGAFCIWTADCQRRVAGWESVDFEDADGDVTLANFLDGEGQGRRVIAPGQYMFAACYENATSTLMGINDPVVPMVGAQSSAFTISNCSSNACRCPLTCTGTNSANIGPDRPLVWVRE